LAFTTRDGLILFRLSALYTEVEIGIASFPFDRRFPPIFLRGVLGAHDTGKSQREKQKKNAQ
jgi:hypothetical protein